MHDWLFVGSSLNAPRQLGIATTRFHNFHIITTNSGIRIIRNPDYYFMSPQDGYHEEILRLADDARNKDTHMISLQEHPCDILEGFDEYLDRNLDGVLKRGGYDTLTYSGPICMQYAMNHGCRRLVIIGCDGYLHPHFDYFRAKDINSRRWRDNIKPKTTKKARYATDKVVQPQTQKICNLWPEVEVICIGNPTYTIDAPNWTVIHD